MSSSNTPAVKVPPSAPKFVSGDPSNPSSKNDTPARLPKPDVEASANNSTISP